MTASLTEFSRGAVIPKYLIIELVRSPKTTTIWLILLQASWFLLWTSVAIAFDSWWFVLPFALAFFFEGWIYRKAYRWREKGLITLHDHAMQIQHNDQRYQISFRSLRSIGIWTLVGRPLAVRRSRHPGSAIVAALRLVINDTEQEFHVLNEMHLTPEDKLQFMAPPPTFGALILRACELNKITPKTRKGENWSDWLSA